jgi:hypothetical protein
MEGLGNSTMEERLRGLESEGLMSDVKIFGFGEEITFQGVVNHLETPFPMEGSCTVQGDQRVIELEASSEFSHSLQGIKRALEGSLA